MDEEQCLQLNLSVYLLVEEMLVVLKNTLEQMEKGTGAPLLQMDKFFHRFSQVEFFSLLNVFSLRLSLSLSHSVPFISHVVSLLRFPYSSPRLRKIVSFSISHIFSSYFQKLYDPLGILSIFFFPLFS